LGCDLVGADVGTDEAGDTVGCDLVGTVVGAEVGTEDVVGEKLGCDVVGTVVGAEVGRLDSGEIEGLLVLRRPGRFV
jgi:hypothetical protein